MTAGRWSLEDTAQLIALHARYLAREFANYKPIAKALNRPMGAVRSKIAELRIKRVIPDCAPHDPRAVQPPVRIAAEGQADADALAAALSCAIAAGRERMPVEF